MSSPLYRTHRWRKRRQWQLEIEPLCRLCRNLFARVTAATVADHIEPHNGDETKFWEGALQSLCAPCHSSIKQQLEKSGRITGSRHDGQPIDPAHPWYRSHG